MGQSALSNDQQTELDAVFGCRWFLSTPTSAQALVGTARTNIPGGAGSVLEPIGSIPVDAATFETADLLDNVTIWVGTTAGARDVLVGRVRAAGSVIAVDDTGTIVISMLAKTDIGLLNNDTKAALDDNQYVTIWRFPVLSYLPSQFTSAPAYYKDGDVTYTNQNEITPCMLRLGNHRAVWVDNYRTASPAAFATQSFTATGALWPTSSSISSYANTVPSGWNVTVGSGTSQSLTAEIDPGYYIFRRSVTDNNSVVTKGERLVFVHNASNLPYSITEAQFTADANGWKASLTLEGTAYSTLLWGAPCIIWTDNTATTALRSQYVGWITQIEEISEPGRRAVRVEVSGPGHRLAQLQAAPQILTRAASSFNWIKVTGDLSNRSFFTWWLLHWHSNYTALFDCTPYTTSASSYRLGEFTADRTNIIDQIRAQAKLYGADIYFNASGHLTVDRPYHLLTTAARSSANIRDTLTAARIKSFTPSVTVYPQVGRIDGSAFTDDGSTTTARRTLANGNVGGPGPTWTPIENLTLNSQTELNQITSLTLAWENNPRPSATVEFSKLRNVYEVGDVCASSITSTYRPDNATFDDYLIVTGINANVGEHGTGTVSLTVASATNNEVEATQQTVSSAVVVFS